MGNETSRNQDKKKKAGKYPSALSSSSSIPTASTSPITEDDIDTNVRFDQEEKNAQSVPQQAGGSASSYAASSSSPAMFNRSTNNANQLRLDLLPADLMVRVVLPYLGLKDMISLQQITRYWWENKIFAIQAERAIVDHMFGLIRGAEDNQNQIEAMLQCNPELLLKRGKSGNTPFQEAVKAGDWPLYFMMLNYFKNIPIPNDPGKRTIGIAEGNAIAKQQLDELEARAYSYDLHLRPTILPAKNREPGKLPGIARVILLAYGEPLPATIPNDAILMQRDKEYDLAPLPDIERDPRKIYINPTPAGLQYEVMGLDGKTKSAVIPWDKLPNCPKKLEEIMASKNYYLAQIVKVASENVNYHLTSHKMVDGNLVADKSLDLSGRDMQKIAKHFPQAPRKSREITQELNPVLFERMMTGCHYPLFSLPKKPTLIPQVNEAGEIIKISFWGNVNGKWKLNDLTKAEMKVFEKFPFFPESDVESMPIKSQNIAAECYELLKKYHTVSHYDFTEYLHPLQTYVNNFNTWVNQNNYQQCDDYWSIEVRDPQLRAPGIIGNWYCSDVSFTPVPRFADAELERTLKLYYGGDFFDSVPDDDFAILKGAAWLSRPRCAAGAPGVAVEIDRAAVAALCQVINEKLVELKQHLGAVPLLASRLK